MPWMRTRQALPKLPALLAQGKFSFSFDGMPLVAERLPLRKRANLIKSGLNMLLGSSRLYGLPPALQAEPTNMCNLKCPLCPTGTHSMNRGAGMMSLETFQGILNEVGDVLVAVVLYGWGEPFLNPDVPRMIAACAAQKILTVTSTNGHCLQTIEEALRVVDAGLTALVVALDGSTQPIYQAYRKSGDVEKVKRCIRLIEEAKARRGSSRPYTNLRVVVTQANEGDLPSLEQLARDAGFNMFSCKSVGRLTRAGGRRTTDLKASAAINGRRNIDGFIDTAAPGEVCGYEPAALAHRRFQGGAESPGPKQAVRCCFPFRQPTVFWDGTVVGCEFDYDLEMPWGRIGQQPFAEIWNSPPAIEERRRMRAGTNRPAFCGACPYSARGSGGSILRCIELRPA